MNLLIVGNGFDLFHGLRTSYRDFKSYIISDYTNNIKTYEDKCFLKIILENLLINNICNWNDFENSLGMLDFDKILNNYNLNQSDEMMPVINKYTCSNILLKSFELLDELLNNWISSIDTRCVVNENIKNIIENSFVINFNYTNTIESNYGYSNVFHIHGKLGDKLIYGHDSLFIYPKENDSFLADENIEIIHEKLRKSKNNSAKLLENIISNKKIVNIYIIGHSLNFIDLYYFNIISKVNNNANVYINEYNNDFEDKRLRLKNLGFKNINKLIL